MQKCFYPNAILKPKDFLESLYDLELDCKTEGDNLSGRVKEVPYYFYSTKG